MYLFVCCLLVPYWILNIDTNVGGPSCLSQFLKLSLRFSPVFFSFSAHPNGICRSLVHYLESKENGNYIRKYIFHVSQCHFDFHLRITSRCPPFHLSSQEYLFWTYLAAFFDSCYLFIHYGSVVSYICCSFTFDLALMLSTCCRRNAWFPDNNLSKWRSFS